MAAAVEGDEWLEGDLGGGVGGGGELFGCGVVGVYVGLVVFGVVEFHYLAGDGGLERAVVVLWSGWLVIAASIDREGHPHGRSGRVALPRVNGTLAGLAIFDMVQRLRRVERAVDERNSVVDMMDLWIVYWYSFSTS